MLNQLQIHRKILYDLVVYYLEPVGSTYGRLAYLAALRDPITEKYAHEKLAAVYGEERVMKTLAKCHEELFERLLEMPLARQEEDLRTYVGCCLAKGSGTTLGAWKRCVDGSLRRRRTILESSSAQIRPLCANSCRIIPRIAEVSGDTDNLPDQFCFVWRAPSLRCAVRKHVWLHD